MKIVVFGLWHLGSVTAACMADAGFTTVGLDPGAEVIAKLGQGIPPLHEPGLPALVSKGLAAGTLSFTTDVAAAVGDADIIWVAFDTPVDDEDRADVGYVQSQIERTYPFLKSGAVVLVSSQMPVGSIAMLEQSFAAVAAGRTVDFACSPENLRLGRAIEIFTKPGRIIIGTRGTHARAVLEPVLAKICTDLIWVRVESAEMTKHTLNAFLATCVTFINEIATVCERSGADAAEVERAIRSDPRVGMNTYVKPGTAFAGGTLARDVTFLNEISARTGLELPLLGSVIASNQRHRLWALQRLQARFGSLRGRRIALLGLSYKPGTDAIRRSIAIELCRLLVAEGAVVTAFDPVVRTVPDDLAAKVTLAASAEAALDQAEALMLATEWPEFQALSADLLKSRMASPVVLDQNRFFKHLLADPAIEVLTLGAGA